MKQIYSAIVLILGACLIIGGFIYFGQSLERNVLILDIIVSLVLYSQIALMWFIPIIDMNNKEHREVGMMGVHYTFFSICFVASVAIIYYGISENVKFSYQLMMQLVVFFFLLLGRVMTLRSGDHVKQVYQQEQATKIGKMQLQEKVQSILDYISMTKGVPDSIIDQIAAMKETIRYLSPANTVETQQVENQIQVELSSLLTMLQDPLINEKYIEDTVKRASYLLNKRKAMRY